MTTMVERVASAEKIRFGEEASRDLAVSARGEWLETNGRGGFSFGTVSGMRTRRYHGLLIVATRPPGARMLLLSSLEEAVKLGEDRWELGSNQYPGVVHPAGHEWLAGFELGLFPTWTYRLGGVRFSRSVCAPHGEDAVILTYTATGLPPEGATLELRPLLAYRDYHSLQHQNSAINATAVQGDGWVRFCPYEGCPPLFLCAGELEYEAAGSWYRDFEYEVERERGLDWKEDLYNPGVLRLRLRPGEPLHVIAATRAIAAQRAAGMVEEEVGRRAALRAPLAEYGPVAVRLAQAADQFVVRRGEGGETVIAGYPWFEDWGRDTMIALPGLALTTGRFETARRILATFAGVVDQGMLPNRFPDWGTTPEYNTVDATLWFFVAAWRYLEATKDLSFLGKELLPVFRDIIDWHRRGTRYGIKVDDDGLLRAGQPGVQLTWMDAKVGDWVVTPRIGKPVEIQALWYNALRITEALCRETRQTAQARDYAAWAEQAQATFEREFWYEDGGYLYDVVNGDNRDAALRPNQVFALSLPFPLVTGEHAERVIAVVEEQLLTPLGLRSLAPFEAYYFGQYGGDVWHRDGAYHQGTVWPWLIGPYVDAVLRVRGGGDAAKAAIRTRLQPLVEHLGEAGLGSISEIADADPPYRPNGCPAQAWSVAELLRAWVATA
jgi:predicted glycogen debranching enzyme